MRFLEDNSINPRNQHLYHLALIHESYSNENGLDESYERLEFLGDTVLDLVVSEYLYKKYDQLKEGQLTRIRANYVCKKALYTYSVETGLDKYVKFGVGAQLSRREMDSVISDVFESFLGALYLDLGLENVEKFLEKTVLPHIDRKDIFFYDHKSELKQLCDKNGDSVVYQLIDEIGPPHKKIFTMAVLLNGEICGKGVGGSKKEAEQKAAQVALEKI